MRPGHRCHRLAGDVSIPAIGTRLERGLGVPVLVEERISIRRDEVRHRRPEGGEDSRLPVDQRAVAIERQRVEGGVVEIRHQPLAPPVKFHEARCRLGTR